MGRRERFLIALLALGTIGGFASGFASLHHHHEACCAGHHESAGAAAAAVATPQP